MYRGLPGTGDAEGPSTQLWGARSGTEESGEEGWGGPRASGRPEKAGPTHGRPREELLGALGEQLDRLQGGQGLAMGPEGQAVPMKGPAGWLRGGSWAGEAGGRGRGKQAAVGVSSWGGSFLIPGGRE